MFFSFSFGILSHVASYASETSWRIIRINIFLDDSPEYVTWYVKRKQTAKAKVYYCILWPLFFETIAHALGPQNALQQTLFLMFSPLFATRKKNRNMKW